MPQDAPLTYEERQLSIFILGPWVIGCFLDLLFQGILFGQFNEYLGSYSSDKIGTRLAVIGLAIITTLKSAHTFASAWILLVLHFKDLNGAIALNYTAWWLSGSGLMVATIGLYVQTFFCYRLWVISGKNRYIVTTIIAVLLFAYVSSVVATYYISKGVAAGPHIATWFAAHLSSVFAGDLLITISTAYFLLQTRREALPPTAGFISALVRLTFLTAAPAALCAMLNLVFSQIYTGDNKLISSAFNQALPKLYAISMMWTLNARSDLRRNHGMNNSSARSSRPRISPFTSSGTGKTLLDVRRMFHDTADHTKSDADDFKLAV